ncbi:MAG: class F sortase [Actinomycetota bacterium]
MARLVAQADPKVIGPLLPASKPVALDIPAIGVHSPLLRLGETAERTLEMPQPGPDYNEAGWYKHSPTPGSLGPAIIAGHVDSAAEGPSVFYHLGDLRPGDKVLVGRADGSVAVFKVDGVRRFRKDRFPTQLVYGNTDHAALRLVTCGGPFDSATGHYLDNIVVFASLVVPDGAARTPRLYF